MMHGTSHQRPNLLLPRAKMVLGCLPTLPWCARAWKFSVWVEGLKIDPKNLIKKRIYTVSDAPGARVPDLGARAPCPFLPEPDPVLSGARAPQGGARAPGFLLTSVLPCLVQRQSMGLAPHLALPGSRAPQCGARAPASFCCSVSLCRVQRQSMVLPPQLALPGARAPQCGARAPGLLSNSFFQSSLISCLPPSLLEVIQ